MIYIIALAALLIASYSDLKTREVPDWLNYSLVAIGFGIAVINSIAGKSVSSIAYSVFGFLVMLVFGYFMYYTGQWGGADSKILMGLGALFGLQLSTASFLVAFVMNFLLVGVFYGSLWAFYLAVKNWHKFVKVLKKEMDCWRKLRTVVLAVAIALLPVITFIDDFYIKVSMLSFVIVVIATFYIWLFVRSVEKSSMLKFVSPEQLTEGDWIAEDIIVSGRRVAGPKELGIEKSQIKELLKLKKQNKLRKVLIKEGIPFVPSFLIAFIISYLLGNVFLMLV